jgi:hypothetical protein
MLVALGAALGLNILAVCAGGTVMLDRMSPSFFAMVATLAIITYYFTAIRHRPNWAAGAAATLVIYVGLRFATDTGYAIYFVGRSFPLVDPWLSAADQAMGIDWPAALLWFDGHPVLTNALRLAYNLCWMLTLVSVVCLSATGRHRRLFVVTAADFLALTIVHLIALFAPAIGTYGYYRLSPAFHPHVLLTTAGHTVSHVLALRAANTLTIPPAGGMLGLITFPSYHAVYAIQRCWALWAVPRLRWIGACLSATIVVSAVPHGSHYVIDVICGIAIAILTILLASRIANYVAKRWANAADEWIARDKGAIVPVLA